MKAKLIAAIMLVMFVASNATHFAFAQPSLTLDPSSGLSGTVVTITGSGFVYGSYRVYFDRDGDATYDLGEPYKSVYVRGEGTFTTTLTVPSVPSGLYYIRADVSPYSPPAIASAPFTVVAIWDKLVDIESEVLDIENKLDDKVIPNLNSILTYLTETIKPTLDGIKAKTDTIRWADITTIKTEIGDISVDSGRAGWTTLGKALDDIKDEIVTVDGVVDNIWGKVDTEIDAIKAKTDTINWADVTAIKDAVDTMETDLKSWMATNLKTNIDNVWGKVDTEIDEILTKIVDVKSELKGWFEEGGTIESYVDEVESLLKDGTYGLGEIKNEVAAIKTKTDTIKWDDVIDIHNWVSEIVHEGGAIYEKITAIKAKTDSIVWADVTAIKDAVLSASFGLAEIKDEVAVIQTGVTAIKAKTDDINWADVTDILGYVDDINWDDITYIKGEVDSIKTEVTDIETKLDGGGSFWTFVNDWFGWLEGKLDKLEGKLDKLVAGPELVLRPEGHVVEEYSNVAHSGHWSIKFLIPEGHGQSSGHYDNPGFDNTEAIEDGQRVILLEPGISILDDFNSLSFWYYFPYQAQLTHPTAPPDTVNEWNLPPYVGIFLDKDGDGSADALLMSMVASSGVTDAWTEHTVPDDWWGVYGTVANGKANHNTMAWWKSQHGTASIVEVRLYWGYWAGTYAINDNIVYVDDIAINGIVIYDCELTVRPP